MCSMSSIRDSAYILEYKLCMQSFLFQIKTANISRIASIHIKCTIISLDNNLNTNTIERWLLHTIQDMILKPLTFIKSKCLHCHT